MSVTARIAILVMVSQVCAGLDLDSLITNAVKQVAKQPNGGGGGGGGGQAAKVDGECNVHCETMYTARCLRHNCQVNPAQVRLGIQIRRPAISMHFRANLKT